MDSASGIAGSNEQVDTKVLKSAREESHARQQTKSHHRGRTTGESPVAKKASSEGSPQGRRSVSMHEDAFLAQLDDFLQRVETQIESWEEYSAAMLDERVAHAQKALVNLKNNVLGAGRRRTVEFVRLLESHQSNVRTMSTSEKIARGVDYFESLVRRVEDSHAAHSVQQALAMAKYRLLTLDELPEPWHNNPYIIRGYKFCKGPADCVLSLVQMHNETCNIWTHLAGFFVLLGFAFLHLPNTPMWQAASWVDKLPMLVFLSAALKCLMCSAVWHTFCNISALPVKQAMACVDYTGITVLITASILTTEYSSLYCHPVARSVYMTATLLAGAWGVYFTWSPEFDTAEAKGKRVIFFASLALAGAFTGVHAMFYNGVAPVLSSYLPVFKSLGCYGLGIVFYAFLIPERFAPGSIFDYFGMSHNLWHLCVFGGIYYHYMASVMLLDKTTSLTCAA